MSTPARRVLALYVVTALVFAAGTTGGYFVTGLFSDDESVTIQLAVTGAGNSATSVGNTATSVGNTAGGGSGLTAAGNSEGVGGTDQQPSTPSDASAPPDASVLAVNTTSKLKLSISVAPITTAATVELQA